ncbi:replication initiation protein [Aureibacter tunicatorum]|uniref:Plasmid replication initiation protein n=1 Tax=Aureibacter tunicatorum TaxID=866807 RepID=A0AAE3XQC2_9BACT|nr:replication initiation protein [Aureibacter tunicatorum]MDR6242091.1 plasmid replication initiation protein [Aureibacter tunicatorum]
MKKGNYKLVKKSNKLVNSRNGFSLYQQRIILLMTTLIKDTDETSEYKIPIHDILGLERGTKIPTGSYRHIREAAEGLTNSSIRIQEGKRWRALSFITEARGEYGKDYIYIRFSMEMRPYFLNLKEQFTTYFLHNVYSFKSAYSIRVYELLIQYYPNIKSRKFDLELLKDMLEVKDRYKRFYDFRKRVIDVAVAEINVYSDIKVKYNLLKKGRAVIGIEFIISGNSRVQIQSESDLLDNGDLSLINNTKVDNRIPDSVKKGDISTVMYQKMLSEYNKGLVDYTIQKVDEKKDIKSVTGYVLRALMGGFYVDEYNAKMGFNKTSEEYYEEYVEVGENDLYDDHIDIDKAKEEYEKKWSEVLDKYLSGEVEDDLYEYLYDNQDHTMGVVQRYLKEWKEGNPTRNAKINFGAWLIRKYGSDEEKSMMDYKKYMKDKYGIDV